jgi:hypothetical protein
VRAGVVDLQRFQLFEQSAQRRDRGQPNVRVGRGGIPCELGGILHRVNNR